MFPPRPLYAHGVDRQNPKTPGEGLRALRRGSGQVESRGGTISDCGLWIADYKYEKNQLVEGKIVGIDESGKLGIKIGKEVIYFGFKEIEFVK